MKRSCLAGATITSSVSRIQTRRMSGGIVASTIGSVTVFVASGSRIDSPHSSTAGSVTSL